jgi:hypothetical protein
MFVGTAQERTFPQAPSLNARCSSHTHSGDRRLMMNNRSSRDERRGATGSYILATWIKMDSAGYNCGAPGLLVGRGSSPPRRPLRPIRAEPACSRRKGSTNAHDSHVTTYNSSTQQPRCHKFACVLPLDSINMTRRTWCNTPHTYRLTGQERTHGVFICGASSLLGLGCMFLV